MHYHGDTYHNYSTMLLASDKYFSNLQSSVQFSMQLELEIVF